MQGLVVCAGFTLAARACRERLRVASSGAKGVTDASRCAQGATEMRSLVLSRRCAVLEERWTVHGRGSVVASHGAAEVPAGLPLWTRPEGAAPLACAAAVRRRRTGTCARVDSAPSRKGEAAARGARCGGGLARCSPRCPRACFCGPQARCGAAPTTTCVRRRRAPPP